MWRSKNDRCYEFNYTSALVDVFNEWGEIMSKWFDAEYVMAYLEYVPTIDIVRCKECKYWIEMTHGCDRNPCIEPWWEEDYCSYGERGDYEQMD